MGRRIRRQTRRALALMLCLTTLFTCGGANVLAVGMAAQDPIQSGHIAGDTEGKELPPATPSDAIMMTADAAPASYSLVGADLATGSETGAIKAAAGIKPAAWRA